MMHVLLTPPGKDTTLDNLGILQVMCMPDWADSLLDRMAEEGWTISIVRNPPAPFPEEAPERQRGQGYIGQWIIDNDIEMPLP